MRFKELTPDTMTEAQLAVYREVCAGPRGRLGPPTNVLLRAPELANRSQAIGEYVRYRSSLAPHISEFAIILVGRYWTSQYEWNAHCQLALKAGLDPQIAREVAMGEWPQNMPADVAAAYAFCTELHRDKSVSDETYANAVKVFGEPGVADLIGASGYYTLICMCLKVNQKTLPAGTPLPLPEIDLNRAVRPHGPEKRPSMAELTPEQMNAEQLAFHREITGAGKKLSTPMKVLIHSPELARRAQRVSEYLRFQAELPPQLAQFAIAITATVWKAQTMWTSHAAEAQSLGIPAQALADLHEGRPPSGLDADQAAAHALCWQLHTEKQLSDAVFNEALSRFGERRTVELIGVCGYYTLAAMALKVGRKGF
jgi:4-carboxymuconolactone decarboxylase